MCVCVGSLEDTERKQVWKGRWLLGARSVAHGLRSFQEFPAFSRRSILGQVWRGWAEARHVQEGFPPMLRWTQGLGGSLVVSLVKWSLCLWLG